jgi:tRNA G18 (ribose-2'-O)-methylase SpoU
MAEDLNMIYECFKKDYLDNKKLLKDTTFDTVISFMNNFMLLKYSNQLTLVINSIEKFVKSFYDEFNSEQGFQLKHDLIYLKFYFFEKCLEILSSEDKTVILIKLIHLTFTIFDLKISCENLDILKYILKLFSKYIDSSKLDELIPNDNKANLLYLILTLISLRRNSNKEFIVKNIIKLSDFILDLDVILKANLVDLSESSIQKIENNIIQIFNKLLYRLKSTYIDSFKYTLEILIARIATVNYLENYIYILNLILDDILSIDNIIGITSSKLLLKILENNIPILHKLGLKILIHVKDNFTTNKPFIEKYISIYDILDGYNSHLFKSLWKDLEGIIYTCENYQQNLTNDNEIELYYSANKSIGDLFNIPFNFFLILCKKILSHDNTKIQKFFIKSFCSFKICNKYFNVFIYKTLMVMINNSIFHPENENMSYHTKLGLIAENFFTEWFMKCKELEDNLTQYLGGIANYISFKRVLVYILNVFSRVFKDSKISVVMNRQCYDLINEIVETKIKYLSVYQRIKAWESILALVLRTNDESHIGSARLFTSFLDLIIFKYLNNLISIESVNLLDMSIVYNSNTLTKYLIRNIKFPNNEELQPNCDDYLKLYNGFIKEFTFNDDSCVVYFIFTILLSERREEYLVLFKSGLDRLNSPYMNEATRTELLRHLRTFVIFNNFFLGYEDPTIVGYHNVLFSSLNLLTDNLVEVLNTNYRIIIESNKLLETTSYIKPSCEKYCNKELNIAIFTTLLRFCDIVTLQINIFFNEYNTISELKSFETFETQFVDRNKIFSYDSLLENIFIYSFKILCVIYYKRETFMIYFSTTFCDSSCKLLKELNNLEAYLDKHSKDFLTDSYKIPFSSCLNNILKIKTIILTYFYTNISVLHEDFMKALVYMTAGVSEADDSGLNNYLLKVVDFLDKSNEDDMYYIYRQLNIIKHISPTINIDTIYFKSGLRSITEKRENLKYINLTTFLEFFINKFNLENNKELIIQIFTILCDLNNKRTWLILKIAVDMYIGIIGDNPDLLNGLEDVIVLLAECKEIRGDDSYMLQTCPRYIYSPFNIGVKKIIKQNFELIEEISKYGLYIRIAILELFDTGCVNSNIVRSLIYKLVDEINSNSSNKSEMNFTSKHRKKIRLSQLLLILSKYAKQDNLDNIEKLTTELFEKINLSSVKFYLDLFSLNLAILKPSYLNYLMKILSNPESRTHIVSSSLIILAIILLEKSKQIEQSLVLQTYEIILSLCTSNVCNIRGFAQYFIHKIHERKLDFFNNIPISKYFYTYLESNGYIQKFFKKFDDSFTKYMQLIGNCNVRNLLQNNLDEINCEIFPIDINKEFKELAMETIPIENEDFTKSLYSWKLFCEKDSKVIDIADFQKKYRPLDDTFSIKKTKKKRLDIIVMASLIDKAPNLGGLARTCEVFNMGAMTIHSEVILNDIAFLSAATSAEKWLPLIHLPTGDIEQFIKTYKKLGYLIIGLEQTANSVSLKEFEFTEKCLIVLGNEREGIPQNLINLIDYCIIIPQFGEIRSLNVHVSAALMLWEIVNCLKK